MFDWLGKGTSTDQLIAKGQYQRAINVIREDLRRGPKSARLLQKLADVLILAEEKNKAISIYHHLVDDFANAGFFPKAIAIAKKIQRLDPENAIVQAQLSSMIETKETEEAAAAAFKARTLKPIFATEDETDEGEFDIVIESDGGAAAKSASRTTSIFQGSPLFQDMTPAEVMALVEGLQLRTFEPGEIVVTEGEAGRSMFLLASGIVRVYVRNDQGANNEVRSIDQGDFFGEISLLTGSHRTATITAATACDLLELNRDDLVSIAQEFPQVLTIIEAFCTRRSGSDEEADARKRAE
ncbi:MAG: cyclic nucleotide-binding domain-containing protein [Acidobacteriota bacterium]